MKNVYRSLPLAEDTVDVLFTLYTCAHANTTAQRAAANTQRWVLSGTV